MGVLEIKLLINLNHKYDFWQIKDFHIAKIKKAFPELDVINCGRKDDPIKLLPEAHIYYGWIFPDEWLNLGKKLKWIATPVAGADYIATPKLAKSGILFTTSSGYHGYPMAEHAMGLILSFSRGIIYSSKAQTVKQNYRTDAANEFFDIKGSSMAIIGCGAIGRELAKMAACFGIKVYGVRRNLPNDASEGQIHWAGVGKIAELLPRCKIVVNLLPKSEATYQFFNKEMFRQMKNGTVFINLGRGTTINEDALLWALDEGIISWCGLDVLSQEPSPVGHPLKNHDRVVVTPHSAVFTNFFMDNAVDFFIKQYKKFISGERMENVVF